MVLEHLAGNFREDPGIGEKRGNFELEHLLLLMPVNYEAKLDEIKSGELRNIEHDLRFQPACTLAGNSGNRPILDHRRRDQHGPAHLLPELADPVCPSIGSIGDSHQSNGAGEQFCAVFGLKRGDSKS